MKNLELNNVSLTFKNVERPILNKINFGIKPNDFVILLGSNGSGKSSLLKLIDRRYQATTGNIFLNGKNIEDYSPKKYRGYVASLTQNSDESLFSSFSVFENYKIRATASIPKKRHRAFIADHLSAFNPNLANKLDILVEKLSGGEKQALALALIFLEPPKILLLDEHTSALDPKSANQIMLLTQQMITKHEIACLMTTHDLNLAKQYGNKLIALKQGEFSQSLNEFQKKNLTQTTLLEVY